MNLQFSSEGASDGHAEDPAEIISAGTRGYPVAYLQKMRIWAISRMLLWFPNNPQGNPKQSAPASHAAAYSGFAKGNPSTLKHSCRNGGVKSSDGHPFTEEASAMYRSYHYGEHKYETHFHDVRSDMEAGRKQAAGHAEAQLQAQREQTEELRRVGDSLQSGLEELRVEFEWGFSLLADRMDTQISIMSQIATKLDQIYGALTTPLMQQARELFRLGQQRLREGLDDKALEAFLQSEQKNDVDFLLQRYIGELYLYSTDPKVKDLTRAVDHLLASGRYAEAKRGSVSGWNKFAGMAYFDAAVAYYWLGEKELDSNRQDQMRECLRKAVGLLERSVELWPELLENTNTKAKCHALLHERDEVRKAFEFLLDHDRRYFLKASSDQDFSGFENDLDQLARQAVDSPGPYTQKVIAKLETASEALAWAKRSHPESETDLNTIHSIERNIDQAKESLRGMDVDLVALSRRIDHD